MKLASTPCTSTGQSGHIFSCPFPESFPISHITFPHHQAPDPAYTTSSEHISCSFTVSFLSFSLSFGPCACQCILSWCHYSSLSYPARASSPGTACTDFFSCCPHASTGGQASWPSSGPGMPAQMAATASSIAESRMLRA